MTSDLGVNGTTAGGAVFTFGIEGFGNTAVPEFNSSDKEIFIDTNHDGTFDFAIFLTSIPNTNLNPPPHSNEYVPVLVDLHTNTATQIPFPNETNLLDPVFNLNGTFLLPLAAGRTPIASTTAPSWFQCRQTC